MPRDEFRDVRVMPRLPCHGSRITRTSPDPRPHIRVPHHPAPAKLIHRDENYVVRTEEPPRAERVVEGKAKERSAIVRVQSEWSFEE